MTSANKKKNLKKLPYNRLAVESGNAAYREMRLQVQKVGILDRQYPYYAILALFILAGFFFSLYQVYITKEVIRLILWSMLFGFFSVQISGFVHDSGHRGIFNSTKLNDIAGHISGALLATDFGSWKYRHNLHHAHTNEEELDPDLIEMPFLSFAKSKFQAKKGFWRKASNYQVFFYYPLMLLYNFGLRLYGIEYYAQHFKREDLREVIVFVVTVFIWFILPFFIFPIGKGILVFTVVNLTMSMYLMNVIAPNHKAMPKFAKAMKLSFLDHQILTSSNVYGNLVYDFFYMGLNYQIEHHLFPNCPRNKLYKIAPYVREVCRKRRLEYTERGFIQSNKYILAELKHIAETSK